MHYIVMPTSNRPEFLGEAGQVAAADGLRQRWKPRHVGGLRKAPLITESPSQHSASKNSIENLASQWCSARSSPAFRGSERV